MPAVLVACALLLTQVEFPVPYERFVDMKPE